MTSEIPMSPAVLSLKGEQRRQENLTENEKLDQALEATFPASDPISHSSGSVPSGRTDAEEAERVRLSNDEASETKVDIVGSIVATVRSRPVTAFAIMVGLAYVWRATR